MNLLAKLNNTLSAIPMVSWINKNLSADPASSNSRTLQTIIVCSIIAMLWVALKVTHWVITEPIESVMKTLIISGAGAYGLGKFAEKKGDAQ